MHRPQSTPWLWLALALTAASITTVAVAQDAPGTLPDNLFDELELRHVGPVGNRVVAVTGEPGNANVYYAGAAAGGVWKTTDGGAHWEPVFDDQPAASIGAIAVAPSDPNVVWVGTGESFIRANVSIGNGVYRSTDRGKTWQHTGLDQTGRIARVVVHPQDPDTAWVAALGHVYGPQEERGIYRTQDGGKSWQRVLFKNPDTGASDLVLDPTNPRILFAGLWEIEVSTWSRKSGGPGSGLWTSRDGGDTWTELQGSGLPDKPWGKIGLAMSPADPGRIYALIETSTNRDFAPSDPFQGVLWRSDDGGESWTMTSADNNLVQRPLYYSRATVSPADADEVYFMSVRHSTSTDGGKTNFETEDQPGWDHHDMWIDPKNPDRMIVGHDGGVSISTNRGRSWHRPQLPIAQMYHVAVDDQVPYFLYGNRQDGPSTRGPSNTLTGDEIPIGAWRSVGGCEVGFAVPDPVDTDTVWTGCYDGILNRHDLASNLSTDVSVWPEALESWPAEDLLYRFQWTFPIALSPHDPKRVYVGSQHVHVTTDGGHSWREMSPDLTSNDPELQRRTGGLTLDDAGPTIAPVVFAIAESRLEKGVVWAGTNDGYVQLTRDGGETWTNLTPNLPPSVPPRGTVSNVEPSRHDVATAYLTIDRHQLADSEPYVLKTTDFGQTWRRIDDAVPRSVFSYAHCVREDPAVPGLLYLGTGNGVHVSFDDGASWRRLDSNLPPSPVHWLEVQERFADLVVATYGRGFWILDDLTPLRAAARGLGDEPVLVAPRPAWRFRRREEPMSQPEDPAAGENPEYGASLHYFLPEELDEEAELELAVFDAAGERVIKLEDPPREPGLHRVWWNLRTERTRQVKLRTRPAENPHVGLGDEGWRELSDGGRLSLLVPPGRYTVRLTAGETVSEQVLEVLKDPHSGGSEETIAEQWTLLTGLRDLLDRSAAIVNEVEWLRRQVEDLVARLGDSGRDDVEELGTALGEVTAKLEELESRFFDLRLTGAGQDSLRWKKLLYSRIATLAWRVGGSDHAPTTQAREVAAGLADELAAHERSFAELEDGDVAKVNALLTEKEVGPLVTGLAPPED